MKHQNPDCTHGEIGECPKCFPNVPTKANLLAAAKATSEDMKKKEKELGFVSFDHQLKEKMKNPRFKKAFDREMERHERVNAKPQPDEASGDWWKRFEKEILAYQSKFDPDTNEGWDMVKSFITKLLKEERIKTLTESYTMLNNWVSHDANGDEHFTVEDTSNLYDEINKKLLQK